MRLAELMQPFTTIGQQGDPEIEVTGLAQDSRSVKRGDLFICVRGDKFDGHDFLGDAFAAGAVGAVAERIPEQFADRTIMVVPDVKEILPDLAARFHDYPASRLQMIGVVGTNGKTTSTYLIRSILETAGYGVGLIGTIQNLIRSHPRPAANTTPGPLELQALLAEMLRDGCQYVVMEVSSHAIALGRTRGCHYAAGLFTNITQDHLDFHKSFAEYLRVKQSFFAALAPGGWAVIDGDDAEAPGFLQACRCRTLTYGLGASNLVRAEHVRLAVDGVHFQAVTPVGRLDLQLHLAGHFNVYNALGALGIGLALGLDLPTRSDVRRGGEVC